MSKKKKKEKAATVRRTIWNAVTLAEWLELLTELAPQLNFKLSKIHIRGTCPKHGGDSFWFTPCKGIIKCYGCGYYEHNPVRFIALLAKESTGAATLRLRKRFRSLKTVLSDDDSKQLEEAAAAQAIRGDIVKFMCDSLARAVRHWPDMAALRASDVPYAEVTVEWLVTRQLGDQPTSTLAPEDRKWILGQLCERGLVGAFPTTSAVRDAFHERPEVVRAFENIFAAQIGGQQYHGHLVFPWNRVEGGVGRIKLRSPIDASDGSQIVVTIDPLDGNVGFHGLDACRWLYDMSVRFRRSPS